MTSLIRVGYWRNKNKPKLPDPRGHVDETWDDDERELVVAYLRGGLPVLHMMGSSPCRMCDLTANGNAELTDGSYLWPEGLAHYVEDHGVRLPRELERHVLDRWEILEAAAIRTHETPPDHWLRMIQQG
ncbi:hypothetical protein ACFU7D_02005 [Nocardioides sp. NPDC057577]|uniref:hypothetical protein n=1 Tax=Nocardioides sp. NPDC057577 TaxID=3346171 RepID=UPI00367287B5